MLPAVGASASAGSAITQSLEIRYFFEQGEEKAYFFIDSVL
jgi:hypothetical protein